MHRLLGINKYHPGGLVLGTKHGIKWDNDMFSKGEKPEVLVDYPIYATDYEQIDLFNWQEQAAGMYSVMELTRHINVRAKQIRKCIRDGTIVPGMIVPVSENKIFSYFNPNQVSEICTRFGWTEITNKNRKDIFIDNIRRMHMDHSYKPVFLLAFFDHMDEEGVARLEDVVESFMEFYETRIQQGLVAEKRSGLLTQIEYTRKDIETLILTNPFRVYEEMGVMRHSKYIGVLQLDKAIAKKLTEEDIEEIRLSCRTGLAKYYD